MKIHIFRLCQMFLFGVALLRSPALAALPTPMTIKQASDFGSFDLLHATLDSENNLIVITEQNDMRLRAYSPSITFFWSSENPGGRFYNIAADNAGNSYITNGGVTKFGPGGKRLWVGSAGAAGIGTMIALDDQGGVYVAGYNGSLPSNLYVAKWNVDGVFQWARHLGGSAPGEDKASGLVAMPGGGVVVTGIIRNPAEQIVTIRYSAAGTAQWINYYDAAPDGAVYGEKPGVPRGVVRTSDGGVAVAGMTSASTLAILKYSGSGAQLWANRTELGNIPGANAGAGAIVPGPDGGAVVLAMAHTPSAINALLISVGNDGVTDWTTQVHSVPVNPLWISPDAFIKTAETALTVLPGGGYLVAAGKSSTALQVGGLFSVDAGGGNVTEVVRWQPLSANFAYCNHLFTGTDGSVWALVHDRFVRFGPVPPPPLPVLGAVGFDNLLPASVRFKGTVHPSGTATSYHYEFGLTETYGSSTPVRPLSQAQFPQDAIEPGVTVAAGATYHFRLVATNAGGSAQSPDQTFTTPPSAYQIWTVNAFGSLDAPGGGPADDPDGDGYPNVVDYAFGGNALVNDRLAGLPVSSFWESSASGITFPTIVYRPDPSRTGVTLTPVASNDLVTWSTAGIVVTNLAGGKRAVAQGFQRFMRLQITSP